MNATAVFTELGDSIFTTVAATSRTREPFVPFSPGEATAVLVFLGIFFVFGTVANAFTFTVIWKMKNFSVFNMFLMSLCVSDFLSALNSPLVAYKNIFGRGGYGAPVIFCKLGEAMTTWTVCSTIQHVLLFAILRFVSLRCPHKFRRITKRDTQLILAFVWIETCVVGFVPAVAWNGLMPMGQTLVCHPLPEWKSLYKTYIAYYIPIFNYAPILGALVMSVVVGVLILLRGRSGNLGGSRPAADRKNEKRALIQLSLVCVTFCLGYIPQNAYRLMALGKNGPWNELARRMWQSKMTFYCLLRLSECMDPVFYSVGSSKIRTAAIGFLPSWMQRLSGRPGGNPGLWSTENKSTVAQSAV